MTDHKYQRSPTNPGAIVNKDSEGLKAYKMRKQLSEKQEQRMTRLENDMSEIKQLLMLIVNKEGSN